MDVISFTAPKITAVILNWRSPIDTIKTVKALISSNQYPMNIIIVDNASGDSSLDIIEKELSSLEIYITRLDQNMNTAIESKEKDDQIILIQNKNNLGYAGGNNIGIKTAIHKFQAKYVLIVNTDARPKDKAIQKLVETMEINTDAAFCTGVLVYPGEENKVQCIGGGSYYPLLGRSRLLGKGKNVHDIKKADIKIDYLMGACLLVRTDAILDFGLMDEDYFLYAEEMDWQRHAKNAGWKLIVCKDAIIEHGDSVTTKGSGRSHLFYYYINRNNKSIL